MNKHWVWVLTVASAACAAPTETSSTVGYVLLDRDARAAGVITVGGLRSSPRLPVAADGADKVEFRAGDETPREIRWRAQKLAYLHGSNAEIEWLELGRDARADALLLNGDATAADAVASIIGAKPTRSQDGLYRIASPDIYFKLAFSGEPDSLVETFPEYLPLSETSRSSAPHVFNADELMPLGREEGSRRGAELVGLYRFGERLLVLDASGQYTLEDDCAGLKKTSGTYRPVRGGVVLDDATGVIALSADGETLVAAEGQRFTPLVAEEPQQVKRQLGLLHQVDEDGDEP